MIKVVPYNVTKGTAEIYRFRAQDGGYWAEVIIDTNPNSRMGRISIFSDFGSWNYFWGACGETFKKFLSGLDKHYLAGKFGADKCFDGPATFDAMKTLAEETHTTKSAQYRNIMEIISDGEKSCSTLEDFTHFMRGKGNPSLMRMSQGIPDVVYRIEPGFENFWGHIWPVLLDAFKSEEAVVTEEGLDDMPLRVELTIEDISDEGNRGKVFAYGTATNTILASPIKWIAKIRDGDAGWAIYWGQPGDSIEFIKKYGNKVHDNSVIRKLVPCTDEAFACYRK